MKERPILFSAPMVRAILEGRKTQTRRVVKPQPIRVSEHIEILRERGITVPLTVPDGWQWKDLYAKDGGDFAAALKWNCPYGAPGDRLWVREAWGPRAGGVVFRGDDGNDPPDGNKWRPSIHMPRWASRITLEVAGVRVERLQDISEEDARAEGVRIPDAATAKQDTVDVHGMTPYRAAFAALWDEINGAESWDANVWVWVVEFRRSQPGERVK